MTGARFKAEESRSKGDVELDAFEDDWRTKQGVLGDAIDEVSMVLPFGSSLKSTLGDLTTEITSQGTILGACQIIIRINS